MGEGRATSKIIHCVARRVKYLSALRYGVTQHNDGLGTLSKSEHQTIATENDIKANDPVVWGSKGRNYRCPQTSSPYHITTLNLPPSKTMATQRYALPPGIYVVGFKVGTTDKEIANPGGDNMQLYLENKSGHESHKVCCSTTFMT